MTDTASSLPSPEPESAARNLRFRDVAPLAGVIAASMANVLAFLALPDVRRCHEAKEIAFFFFLDEQTVLRWQGRLAAWTEPLHRLGQAVSGEVSWRGTFLLLMLAPAFATLTAVALVAVFRRRPWIERIVASLFALASLPAVLYACFIIWYALMKMHYLS